MKKLVLDNKEVRLLASKICRELSGSTWKPDYIVGITRGGLVPAVMISHWFNIPCNTLKVALRDNQDAESNLWMAEDAFGYHRTDLPEPAGSNPTLRKNILIVDDINDSGATFDWIVKDWQSGCFPQETETWNTVWNRTTRFAVLVDNLASDARLPVDYAGSEINKAEEDVWIDFPWEVWWR